MAEYIERESLCSKAIYLHGFGKIKYVPLKAIEEAKTADVAPVRRGLWGTTDSGQHKCSCCHTVRKTDVARDHYCPNCGAKMD